MWIAHPNGEWTNYSHISRGSLTAKAGLKVGDWVKAGQYIGDEDAIGCAMLKHVHFEVAVPNARMPIDPGGFLTDNEGGKRERNPRFCGVPGGNRDQGRRACRHAVPRTLEATGCQLNQPLLQRIFNAPILSTFNGE